MLLQAVLALVPSPTRAPKVTPWAPAVSEPSTLATRFAPSQPFRDLERLPLADAWHCAPMQPLDALASLHDLCGRYWLDSGTQRVGAARSDILRDQACGEGYPGQRG